jgi:hypothetical protein
MGFQHSNRVVGGFARRPLPTEPLPHGRMRIVFMQHGAYEVGEVVHTTPSAAAVLFAEHIAQLS